MMEKNNPLLTNRTCPCGCLAKDMKIQMADRVMKAIQDIRTGEQVSGADGMPLAVRNTMIGTAEKVFRLCLADGSALTATKEHPVMTDEGLKQVKDFTPGDTVNTTDGMQAIDRIDEIKYEDMVYNLELDGGSHLMICEGILVGDYAAEQTFPG